MINEITYYVVTCNTCGDNSEPALTEEVAIELATDAGWIIEQDKHFCSHECKEVY